MKPVLFLVGAASSYRLQKFVAAACVQRGWPVAYLYERDSDGIFAVIERDAASQNAKAVALGSTIDDRSGTNGPIDESSNPNAAVLDAWARLHESGVRARLERWIKAPRALRAAASRMASDLDPEVVQKFRRVLGGQLHAAERAFQELSPAAIVACEDGISSLLSVHAVARKMGIPVVVVPYGYGVRRDLEISLEPKVAANELQTIAGAAGQMVERLAPQWVKQGAFAGALMFPPAYVLAAESLGITLRDAWMIHGGYAQRLCAESPQMMGVYRAEGVPETKLRLTGSPYCDMLARSAAATPEAAAALGQPRRLRPGVTRVLVSWPPSYHGDRADRCEFSSYRELSVAVLGWLAQQAGARLTVSLHPATLEADRRALSEAGVTFSDEYVIDLIPHHDVFVTYFSSTIRWAIAAGKPVVNLDAYRLDLDVYSDAPGVITVNRLDEFKRAMSDLIGSETGWVEVAERQIAVAPHWGVLDGESTSRILSELEHVSI